SACARLVGLPVLRLSTPTTWWPSESSRSTRVEPMNPAAPVIKTRIFANSVFRTGTNSLGLLVASGAHARCQGQYALAVRGGTDGTQRCAASLDKARRGRLA